MAVKILLDFLGEIVDEFTDVIKEIIKPRTFFAFMFYATFCYLIINQKTVPESLNNIVFSLISFWFGTRVGENIKNGDKNEKPIV